MQDLYHKFDVLMVVPSEKCVNLLTFVLRNSKELFEWVKEVKKDEVLVKTDLHVLWQLPEKVQILFKDEGLVVVVGPLVLKMLLNSLLKVFVNPLFIVKVLDGTEKLGEVLRIIEVLSDPPEGVKNVGEIVHDQSENDHTGKQNYRAKDPLWVGPWVKVSKANSREGSKSIVNTNDQDFFRIFVIDSKVWLE